MFVFSVPFMFLNCCLVVRLILNGIYFSDLFLHDGFMQIPIRCSKTDQLGQRCSVRLRQYPASLVCPFYFIKRFLEVSSALEGHLLIHRSGLPLTCYQFCFEEMLAKSRFRPSSYLFTLVLHRRYYNCS